MNPAPSHAAFRAFANSSPYSCDLARALLALFAMYLVGCGDSDRLRVDLAVKGSRERDPRRLMVYAQVSGPQEGLSYRWFSETGECMPQRTDTPESIYIFGEGKTRDRVIVEVWRENRSVARGELAVERASEAPLSANRRPKIQIEMTDTPPYDPIGGPNTRAHIGGSLSGDLEPGVVVIIYARAHNTWFVQPVAGSKHSLRSDNTFSTWTHTGSEYAVLAVRLGFNPQATTPALQVTDNDVLGHLIVEGERSAPR